MFFGGQKNQTSGVWMFRDIANVPKRKFNSEWKPLKNGGWKITYLLGRELFRGYVKLRVCIFFLILKREVFFAFFLEGIWMGRKCHKPWP